MKSRTFFGSNDAQMLHSVSGNSNLISRNSINKQSRGAQDC